MNADSKRSFSLLCAALLTGITAGIILTLFSAPYWVWSLILLMVIYLAISGTGSLFLINLALTSAFTVVVLNRLWPASFYPYIHPIKQPQQWAIAVLMVWVIAIAQVVFMALSAQQLILIQIGLRKRVALFCLNWVGGLCIGALIFKAYDFMQLGA